MSDCSKPDDPVPGTTPTASAPEAPGTSAAPGGAAPATEPAAQQDTPPVAPPGPVAPCVTCEITSETIMTQPPDRARTSIGVGERVSVTFSLGDAAWTLAGEGFLSSPTGQTIIYRAPSKAQTVTLTATGGGCTATKSFTIIAPTSVKMRTRDTLHRHDSVTIGLHTDIYILPDTVNFHAIEIREVDAALVSSGVFLPLAGGGHIRNPPSGVGSAVAATTTVRSGFGTKIDGIDTVLLGFLGAIPPAAVGRGQWTIPWQYALRGGTFRNFDTVYQLHTCDAIGNLRASKAHAVATATYASPSSGSFTQGGVTTVL